MRVLQLMLLLLAASVCVQAIESEVDLVASSEESAVESPVEESAIESPEESTVESVEESLPEESMKDEDEMPVESVEESAVESPAEESAVESPVEESAVESPAEESAVESPAEESAVEDSEEAVESPEEASSVEDESAETVEDEDEDSARQLRCYSAGDPHYGSFFGKRFNIYGKVGKRLLLKHGPLKVTTNMKYHGKYWGNRAVNTNFVVSYAGKQRFRLMHTGKVVKNLPGVKVYRNGRGKRVHFTFAGVRFLVYWNPVGNSKNLKGYINVFMYATRAALRGATGMCISGKDHPISSVTAKNKCRKSVAVHLRKMHFQLRTKAAAFCRARSHPCQALNCLEDYKRGIKNNPRVMNCGTYRTRANGHVRNYHVHRRYRRHAKAARSLRLHRYNHYMYYFCTFRRRNIRFRYLAYYYYFLALANLRHRRSRFYNRVARNFYGMYRRGKYPGSCRRYQVLALRYKKKNAGLSKFYANYYRYCRLNHLSGCARFHSQIYLTRAHMYHPRNLRRRAHYRRQLRSLRYQYKQCKVNNRSTAFRYLGYYYGTKAQQARYSNKRAAKNLNPRLLAYLQHYREFLRKSCDCIRRRCRIVKGRKRCKCSKRTCHKPIRRRCRCIRRRRGKCIKKICRRRR